MLIFLFFLTIILIVVSGINYLPLKNDKNFMNRSHNKALAILAFIILALAIHILSYTSSLQILKDALFSISMAIYTYTLVSLYILTDKSTVRNRSMLIFGVACSLAASIVTSQVFIYLLAIISFDLWCPYIIYVTSFVLFEILILSKIYLNKSNLFADINNSEREGLFVIFLLICSVATAMYSVGFIVGLASELIDFLYMFLLISHSALVYCIYRAFILGNNGPHLYGFLITDEGGVPIYHKGLNDVSESEAMFMSGAIWSIINLMKKTMNKELKSIQLNDCVALVERGKNVYVIMFLDKLTEDTYGWIQTIRDRLDEIIVEENIPAGLVDMELVKRIDYEVEQLLESISVFKSIPSRP